MKKEELKMINKSINQLNNLKKLKEEEIQKEENKFEKEIEDEIGEQSNEAEKMTGQERMVLALELQKFINLYSKYEDYENTCKPDNRLGEFTKRSFKMKIIELSYVIIKKYIDSNKTYFGFYSIENLVRILDRILKIDYRKEKESMIRIKALIKFCNFN